MTLAVVFTALGVTVAAVAAHDKATASESPCVALTGSDSHVSERGYHRITSMNDWKKLWQKHKGQNDEQEYDQFYDPLALPVVDFDRYMVIAIFQGRAWNSAGLVVSVSDEEERIVFRFNDKSYQTLGPDGGGKRATVYGFFVVPRSMKPVILEEDVQRLKGQPPKWKERATFPKL
jgi:hypothetical protein